MKPETKTRHARHTLGPWQDIRLHRYDRPRICKRIGEGHVEIASCTCLHNPDETEANARLIAAAPELLEACKAVRALEESTRGKGLLDVSSTALQDAYNTVRAAITQATGETKL